LADIQRNLALDFRPVIRPVNSPATLMGSVEFS
jgi:hypothetical protein